MTSNQNPDNNASESSPMERLKEAFHCSPKKGTLNEQSMSNAFHDPTHVDRNTGVGDGSEELRSDDGRAWNRQDKGFKQFHTKPTGAYSTKEDVQKRVEENVAAAKVAKGREEGEQRKLKGHAKGTQGQDSAK